MRIILAILLFFIGCSQTKEEKTKEENKTKEKVIKTPKTKKIEKLTIQIEDLNISIENGKLKIKDRVIFLFEKDNRQSGELNRLGVKYYKTLNPFLIKYFHITKYPTIVVVDQNQTIKYENFIPFEMLKAEGF